MWWTKRTFDFRRERRGWSRCHCHFVEKTEKQSTIKFRERLHAPWWRLPTFLCHDQLPCSNPVSSCPFDLRESRRCILPQRTAYSNSTRAGWRKRVKSGCPWRGTTIRNQKQSGEPLLAKIRPASETSPRACRHNDAAISLG